MIRGFLCFLSISSCFFASIEGGAREQIRMVESVVFFAAERLGDFIIQNAVSFEGVHQQVVRLRAELMRMQCILNDADTRQEDNAGVHKCVYEIQNAASDAEDTVDLRVRTSQLRGLGLLHRNSSSSP